MEIKDLEVKLGSIESEIKKFAEKHAEELKTLGSASTETKTTLEKLGNEWKDASLRLLTLEQKMDASNKPMKMKKTAKHSKKKMKKEM